MSRKQATKDFGPVKLTVVQLPPTKALELLPEVISILLPAAATSAGMRDILQGNVEDLTIEKVMGMLPAVKNIADSLMQRRLGRITPELLGNATAVVGGATIKLGNDGVPVPGALDVVFSDCVAKTLAVAWFALGVTFRDFLEEFALAAAKAKAAVPSPDSSPSTSPTP